jgi:heptosyltransferase-2/heptosyltransferase-3
MITPALHLLHAGIPNAQIDVAVGPWSKAVLDGNPDIDRILIVHFPAFDRTRAPSLVQPYRTLKDCADLFRKSRYDAAVILRPDDWWSAAACWMARIPVRVGIRKSPVRRFLTHALPDTIEHSVVLNARSCAVLHTEIGTATPGPLRFVMQSEHTAQAADLLKDGGVTSDQPFIVVHPGAGADLKRWDAVSWAAVIDALHREYGTSAVVTGSEAERGLTEAIVSAAQSPCISLAGRTDLGTLAALIARSVIILGPDTGPLHLACAVGTPSVALYGPANPVEYGPWGDRARHQVLTGNISCQPCRIPQWPDEDPALHPCVRMIEIAQVIQSARAAIEAGQLHDQPDSRRG